ncbi:MAG: ATP-dependent zinc metalloprotease FtsH [Planctomycetes bacterium]|nr:ATP-dependent zinc metalloprotease FtsH [Planctomycetota bacterium]
MLMAFFLYRNMEQKVTVIMFEQMLEQAHEGKIKSIIINGNQASGQYRNPDPYDSFKVKVIPEGYLRESEKPKELYALKKQGLIENIEYAQSNTFLYQLLWTFLPWIFIFGVVWYFFFRQIRSSGNPTGIFSFGRSKTRIPPAHKQKVTFADVAGIEEAREEVEEIIMFLKNPKKFQELGGRLPRGVILVGPPGSGKTLLAKAIAGEANVPFLSMSGSDFVEMFVGVGASRVRDLFRQAKENSPAIIFLDEIDAVGRQRGAGLGGGHDEREQTLNAILVEMDGFDTDTGVIVIAATNRPDVLDSALLRPGRFDRQIDISLPDIKGREAILKVHARKVKLNKSVDLKKLANITPMFSGADLEAVINEAALLAVMKKKESVDMSDLEESRDKVRWGRQKRSRVMDEEDKKVTAYHESGHALAAYFIPEAEKVHKVTIVPRGSYLGATMQMPEKDRYHMHKKYLLGTITVFFAGRVAEEIFCDDISAGAQSDIKQATHLARMMVCEWGMSEKLGPISYTDSEEHLFLGREISRTKPHSEATALAIDQEIKDILMKCYERAKKLIADNKDACQRMAQSLMKHETLNTSDVTNIVKGIDIDLIKEKENNDQKKKSAAKTDKTKPEKSSTPTPPDKESGTTVSK